MSDESKVIPITGRKSSGRRPASAPPDDSIRLGVDVHRIVDDCSAALARCDEVFCRSGELVRVVCDAPLPPDVKRSLGAPTIRSVHAATLLEILSRIAMFSKLDKRTMDWLPAIPGAAIVSALAERGSWPGMRPLHGLLEAPALRPDGTVIQESGYDEATGYVLVPSTEFPTIADRPTADDARSARDELLEVVSDFPFASDEHRAAWLAFQLTLFARPAIEGCVPFVAVDATAPGTGKGRLVDATALIATGREATKTPLPQDDEECRKRITSLLVEGERFAVLDNVADVIVLPSLDAALTATVWRDRLLGKNTNVTVPNLMLWAATANNLHVGGDLARRTLHIRLESRIEDPENRNDFRHPDLLAWVRAERPRLVHAALTILRAHAVAGWPSAGVRSWGSFESWSRVVAAAVAWTGLPDPQATRSALQSSADTTKTALRTLVDGWARLCAETPEGLTAKAAVALLYTPERLRGAAPPDGYDDLREAIEELVATQPGKPPSTTKLAGRLRSARKRVIAGRMLDCDAARSGIMRWRVVGRVGGVGGDAPSPTCESVSDKISTTGGSNPPEATNPSGEQRAFGDLVGGAE